MFCNKCGANIKDEAKFCPKCGAAVLSAPDINYGGNNGGNYQPRYQQPQPYEYAPAQYMTQPSNKTGAVKIVFSCILALLFFVNMLLTFGVASVKSLANSETIKSALMKADIPNIEVEENGVKKNVGDLIYDRLPEGMRSDTGMSREDFKALLDDNSFKSGFSDLIGRYISHIAGDKTQTVTKQDILNTIKSNEYLIYTKAHYRLTETDYREIERILDSNDFKMITTEGFDNETTGVDLGTVIGVVLGVFAFLAIVCAGIILLINRRHISHTLLYLGIPLMFLGFNFLMFALSVSAVSVISLLKPVMWIFTVFGIIMLLLGAAMVAAFIIIFILRRKRELIQA